jgi:hypothetical protein
MVAWGMRKLVLLLCLLAAPAAADERARAEELAREGAGKLLRALELFLESIPRYGAPRVEPNGDIVIPRAPRRDARPDDRAREPETLRT